VILIGFDESFTIVYGVQEGLNISNEKQKTTTAVREISNELKKIPITAIVAAEKINAV
jgi:hypothetical protein